MWEKTLNVFTACSRVYVCMHICLRSYCVALGDLKFTILLQPPECWSIGVCHHLCRIWLEWLQIDVNCEFAHSSLSFCQGSTLHKWNGNSTVQSMTPQTCVDFSACFLFLLWKEKDFTISEDLCIVIEIENWYLKILQNIFTFTFFGVWVYIRVCLWMHTSWPLYGCLRAFCGS